MSLSWAANIYESYNYIVLTDRDFDRKPTVTGG